MRIGLCVLGLLVLSHSQAQPAERGLVLFSVAGNPVNVDEFVWLYKKNNAGREENFTEQKVLEYLDLYINFKLKVHEARQRGMDTTKSFMRELETYREELKKPYLADNNTLEKLVTEAYERLTHEVKASHILVHCPPDAAPADTLDAFRKITALRQRALQGEDFAQLARENSDDPSARTNGGNLGYFTAFQMVYPFESAAFSTPAGEISPPVRTRFGYHIVKVEDNRPSSGEVEVSHIFLRGHDQDVKDRILEIAGRLKAGMDWKEAVAAYSEDPGTKNSDGRLRPFGIGSLSSARELEVAAFALDSPGEISEPVKTNYGWHLLRLEKKIPVPAFAEIEQSLRRRVGRDDRLKISEQKQFEKKKVLFKLWENPILKSLILSMADSSLIRGKWHYEGADSLLRETLISVDSEEISAAELVDYIEEQQQPSSLHPAEYARQLYDRFVAHHLSRAEDRMLQQKHPEYKNMLKEYHEGILMFGIMEQEVWNKASNDSLGQRTFYEQRKANYEAGDRVEARVIACEDKEVYEKLKTRIAGNDTIRESDLEKTRVLPVRKYAKGDHPAIDRIDWSVGWKDMEVDGMYYLVEVKRLVAPGLMSFEEARASVISDYQDYLERQWIESLKQRYPVKVNKKGRKQALKLLIKEKAG